MKREILTRLPGQPQPSNEQPPFSRPATVAPQSYNPADRTMDLVMSTGARGVRYDWWSGDQWEEELAMDAGAVDLSRMNNSAPFLDVHRSSSADNVLGILVPGSVRIQDGALVGKVQFATDQELDDYGRRTVLKIINGTMRNLSIGYNVEKWEITRAKDRKDGVKMDLFRGVAWTGFECSTVPMGFDDAAMTRGHGAATTTPIHREQTMENEHQTPTPGAPAERGAPNGGLDEAAIRAEERAKAERAAADETKRATEIMERGRVMGIDDETTLELVRKKTPLTDALRTMMDIHAERKEEQNKVDGSFNLERVRLGRDERDTHARGLIAALATRLTDLSPRELEARMKKTLDTMDPREARKLTRAVDFKPEHFDVGVSYANRTMTEMGSMLLRDLGIDHGGSRDRDEIARDMIGLTTRANTGLTVSDFPLLFQDAMHVALIILGEEEPLTFEPIVRTVEANDFRTRYAVKFGGGGRWKKTEKGKGYDFSQGLAEEGESYKVFTWSVGFMLERQMLVDDNLGVVQSILQDHATGARIMQNDLVWTDTLLSAKVMSDGKPLFDAAHGNVSGAAAAPSLQTLDALYTAMGAQKGPGATAKDKRQLNLQPMILALPATGGYFLAAHQLLYGQIAATKVEDTVPASYVQNLMMPIREARIPSTKWFGFASPRRAPVVEVAYLNNQRTPNVEQLESSRMAGIKYGAWMDLGASLVDWRGVYANQAAT